MPIASSSSRTDASSKAASSMRSFRREGTSPSSRRVSSWRERQPLPACSKRYPRGSTHAELLNYNQGESGSCSALLGLYVHFQTLFFLRFPFWLRLRTLGSFAGNCPGWLASDGPEGEDQFFRLLHERFEDIPALLFGGREHGSDDHEVIGAVLGTESTGDFLP